MQVFTAATAERQVPATLLSVGLPAASTLGATGTRRSFARGDGLFAEGAPASFFYRVVSGTVRTCALLSDGRRQIDAFHLAGDIFGLESATTHRVRAEAVDHTEVIAFRRSLFTSLLHDDPSFGDQLMSSTIRSLERANDYMVLLGRKTAQEKVAAFLLEMADRLSHDGSEQDRFDLPMQRCDIADHLGLTIETVSRVLTGMARDGLIDLAACGRTIVLNDRTSLRQLNA